MERPAAQASAKRRRSLRRDLAGGSALLLAAFCFAAAGGAWFRRSGESPHALLVAGLAAQACFACLALGGAWLVGPSALPRGLLLVRPRLRGVELLLVAVGFVTLSYALSLLLAALALRETGTLAEIDRAVASARGPARLLALVALGAAPALAEELLFRGFVQQVARVRLGAAAAVALSALAFGAVHGDLAQSPAALVLGLYLGVAVEVGRSLCVGVACHAANNALAVLLPPLGVALPLGRALALGAVLAALAFGLLAAVAARAPQGEGPLQPGSPRAD